MSVVQIYLIDKAAHIMNDVLTAFLNAPLVSQVLTVLFALIVLAILVLPRMLGKGL